MCAGRPRSTTRHCSISSSDLMISLLSTARCPVVSKIKRQFGSTVDFVGDNRVIFDLGGNKYRLIVHISFAFGRVLVKFIGTHAEYDRIDPETVSWRKK